MRKRVSKFTIVPVAIVIILITYSNCQNELFTTIIEATQVPDPPVMSGDAVTGNIRPTWSWTVPQNVTKIRYQLDRENP